mmetsp:Transcript_23629/g.66756  ORF Transcript_23629/g.66756 Transcript_23629/m.66756 type:complete len:209 (+) Transcript_23629:341-967(+)
MPAAVEPRSKPRRQQQQNPHQRFLRPLFSGTTTAEEEERGRSNSSTSIEEEEMVLGAPSSTRRRMERKLRGGRYTYCGPAPTGRRRDRKIHRDHHHTIGTPSSHRRMLRRVQKEEHPPGRWWWSVSSVQNDGCSLAMATSLLADVLPVPLRLLLSWPAHQTSHSRSRLRCPCRPPEEQDCPLPRKRMGVRIVKQRHCAFGSPWTNAFP